ncbi:FecR family protein [Niabella beijingensis]|uniref:FecR family protein n=1 Tax=Niabella beijingensis TaxID=2872700 RepID=UPI001CBD48CF|nr:FecR domain-containing protein [Niabella beijingensis]MBZ4190256.1 DUF4974 domain-containing protein [Niabella beijingensis]
MRNELSPDEEAQFLICVKENDRYRQLAEAIGNSSRQRIAVEGMEGKLKAIWARIETAPELKTRRPSFLQPPFFRIAAVLILAAGIGLAIRYYFKPLKDDPMIVLQTTNEKLYTTLPDGTQVTLNYHSLLEYNTDFGDEKRKIILQGEAFFDVTENKKVPLQVLAGPLVVEVKGTAFNVNAYKTNPDVKVVLLRGAIEVSRRGEQTDKVLLKPNQWLLAPNTGSGAVHFSIDSVDQALVRQMHWKDDSLVFKKEKLEAIALQLEKKYGVTIAIENETLKAKRFSGMLINESLTEGLEALRLAYPFSYKIENKKVKIR